MPKLRCFIAAPYYTKTDFIEKILTDKGVEFSKAYDSPVVNYSIEKQIKNKIKKSDFVIAIVSKNNIEVFYEIGLAEGLGKPLFIINDKKSEIPACLQNHLHLKTTLKINQSLIISVSKFADEARRTKDRSSAHAEKRRNFALYDEQITYHYPRSVTTVKTKHYGLDRDTAKKYLNEISLLRTKGSGLQLEKIVEEVLKKLNLQIVQNQYGLHEKRVDFAIWCDDLHFIIGNPIFVEVKYGKLNQENIDTAETQLVNIIQKSDAKAGLLLYLDRDNKRFAKEYFTYPLIRRFDIQDFINDLSKYSFQEIIRDVRNRIMHNPKI